MKAIKLLQYVTIGYGMLLVTFGFISLFNVSLVERYVAIIGAMMPYIIPQAAAAFAGNPLKKYIEGKNGDTEKC